MRPENFDKIALVMNIKYANKQAILSAKIALDQKTLLWVCSNWLQQDKNATHGSKRGNLLENTRFINRRLRLSDAFRDSYYI